ncbi:hypothetical protein [Streptomyces sp. TRM72054]|uniref:hypothetical protein n=1 Tax=Streptomyces sp. TRM72054 TaxID=2870562 RepID=UPI0035AC089E
MADPASFRRADLDHGRADDRPTDVDHGRYGRLAAAGYADVEHAFGVEDRASPRC